MPDTNKYDIHTLTSQHSFRARTGSILFLGNWGSVIKQFSKFTPTGDQRGDSHPVVRAQRLFPELGSHPVPQCRTGKWQCHSPHTRTCSVYHLSLRTALYGGRTRVMVPILHWRNGRIFSDLIEEAPGPKPRLPDNKAVSCRGACQCHRQM